MYPEFYLVLVSSGVWNYNWFRKYIFYLQSKLIEYKCFYLEHLLNKINLFITPKYDLYSEQCKRIKINSLDAQRWTVRRIIHQLSRPNILLIVVRPLPFVGPYHPIYIFVTLRTRFNKKWKVLNHFSLSLNRELINYQLLLYWSQIINIS